MPHEFAYDVAVVGGGPVGMFLALRLIQLGLRVVVVEKTTAEEKQSRKDAKWHSRAIGIHPPSLELLNEIDPTLIDEFVASGVRVFAGYGLTNSSKDVLGRLPLGELLPKPFNFVLSCPQNCTESILRNALLQRIANDSSSALLSGTEVVDVQILNSSNQSESESESTAGVRLVCKHSGSGGDSEAVTHIDACYVVGCDGKKSIVRKKAGIQYTGRPYIDTFIMGDFEDNTEFRSEAAIFLADDGLVECFPLPNGMRRWVCSTEHYERSPSVERMAELIQRRTQIDISAMRNTMLSTYGVQGFIAEHYYARSNRRLLLAGDAAHICSPLGGQGMNLGFFDAWRLAAAFEAVFYSQTDAATAFEQYERQQKPMALSVIKRAEFNMSIGRKTRFTTLRSIFVRLFLKYPMSWLITQAFTMRMLGAPAPNYN